MLKKKWSLLKLLNIVYYIYKGILLLETMASRTPVVGPNRAYIPEIIGDAGLIVNPDNTEEMAHTIYKILTDRQLRRKLIYKGYRRAQMFSWNKTAKKILEIIERV